MCGFVVCFQAFKGLQSILEKLYVPERPHLPLALPVPQISWCYLWDDSLKFIINSFKRPCLHYANFLFLLQEKIVNRKPFLVRMSFSQIPKCCEMSQNFKDAVEKVFEAKNFLSDDKIFCPLTTILRWVISLCEHELTFLVTWKLSRTSSANKVTKTKNIGNYKNLFKVFAITKLNFLL